jgi:hypothetical protein
MTPQDEHFAMLLLAITQAFEGKTSDTNEAVSALLTVAVVLINDAGGTKSLALDALGRCWEHNFRESLDAPLIH